MNIKAGHTIEKLTFDIQIPKEKNFHYISDIISSITAFELPQILETLLDEYSLNDQTIQIQHIALDLGDISLNQTRNQLISQLKNTLKSWFLETFKLTEQGESKNIRTLTSEEREFYLLRYFITSGMIPWWGTSPAFIPDESLKKYIREYSQKTKNLIFELGEKKSNRQRIVYQFKDDTLYQLFGILSPKPSSFFRYYASDLTYIHQKQKVVDEEDQAFKKVLQELILTYLISHKATSIDQTAFFKKQMLMLSKQYGISYKNILHRMNEAIRLIPKNYTFQSDVKAIVSNLLRSDFTSIISLPEATMHTFEDYAEILVTCYKEKPEHLSGKLKSKRERDAFLRQMLKMNKQKTLLLLKYIHRKNILNVNQSGLLFSENALRELIKLIDPSALDQTLLYLEPLKKIDRKYYVFASSTLSVKSIVYSNVLFYLNTKNEDTTNQQDAVFRLISKNYGIPYNILRNLLNKPANRFMPFIADAKNILPRLLKQNYSLYEAFIKKVAGAFPGLSTYLHSTSFLSATLQLLADKPNIITHFPLFISEISLFLSKRLSITLKDFQQGLVKDKTSVSSNLYRSLTLAFSDNKIPDSYDIHQIKTSDEPLQSLDTAGLKKILSSLFGQHYSLYEAFIKKVADAFPGLSTYLHSTSFLSTTLQLLADKPNIITHFPLFISEISLFLSKRLSITLKDFQQGLLKDKTSVSSNLYRSLTLAFSNNIIPDSYDIHQIKTSDEPLQSLDTAGLKKILSSLFGQHYSLYEAFIKKVAGAFPGLSTYLHSNQFYIFAIQLMAIRPSDTKKIDRWILKFIFHLAQKANSPIKAFLYPLLSKEIVIPDKLVSALRKIYQTIIETQPTGSDAGNFIYKSNESIEKLIHILGSQLFEEASIPSTLDKSSLFLEILWLKEKIILSKIIENKFNPMLPILLESGLPDEGIQYIQMKMAGENYLIFQEVTNKLSVWLQQNQIIKLPKNKLLSWLKQQSLDFLIQFESRPFKVEDYYYFILEKSQKERLLHWKELDRITVQTPTLLEKEIYYFYSDFSRLPIPKKWRDKQFYQDLILHFLKTGKIQPWLPKAYLGLNELIYLFNDAIKTENTPLIQSIMKLSFHEEMLKRLHQLMDKINPSEIINFLQQQNPQKNILPLYRSLYHLAKKSITDDSLEKVVFNLFIANKIWQRTSETIQYEIIIDALQRIYHKEIREDGATLADKPFTLDGFIYFLESGIWPVELKEEQRDTYFKYIKSIIKEKPVSILNITSNLSYYPFHLLFFSNLLSRLEIGVFLKSILKIKNTESEVLFQIIDNYFIKSSTVSLRENKFQWVLDVLLDVILFSDRKSERIEILIRKELMGIIPEITSKELQPSKPERVTLWEKELEWIDYFLTYGSVPIEAEGINGESWMKMIEKLMKNNARPLLYQLHYWSKSPMKINRLFDVLGQKHISMIMAMIHPALMEHILLMEKSVEVATGEKISTRIGIKNKFELGKWVLSIWGKMSKLHPDTTPIIHKIFSMYVEKRKLQPKILLSLITEKIKNAPSKQLQIIKDLQKYAKAKYEEKGIKKETPAILQEGVPPDSIYVANAGLILLWPFLGRYFRRLQLVGTKDFNDDASRMRGILLTQYLVTGQVATPEYELALNKLLCGAALDMELALELDISEEEINLSNSLLTGAITNWEKLKGTRIGTFRETFLQRSGSLYYINNRWELKVEKKAYDLLLETLPWGIQMIQMSWMKERLVVLWR